MNNTMNDRIRIAVWNLSRVPGYNLEDPMHDPAVNRPVQEAIDLLKDLMAERITMKATPEQINALQELMKESGGYSCMPLEEFDKLKAEQTRAAYGIPEAPEPEEIYKPQGIPEVKYTVQGLKPGTRILVGNQQEPESHQEEQQPREQRHCTAHTTYAPETAITPSPVETPTEVTHHPV